MRGFDDHAQRRCGRQMRKKGHFDAEKFESLTDADIDRMIAEDPELAPATQSLAPLLDMRDIRRKRGLTRLTKGTVLARSTSRIGIS